MIYIVKHKVYPNPVPDGYKEIYVGDIYKGDYEDFNKFNSYLNETTAMYDICHRQDEIVGLVHYRRFFKDLPFERAVEILNDGETEVITTYDHIVEKPYNNLIARLDRKIVDKYLAMLPMEVQEWFHEPHGYNICNMFVCKREFLNEYCEWLFPKIIPMAKKFAEEDVTDDVIQNRTVGFICECLFGYYCSFHKRYMVSIYEI